MSVTGWGIEAWPLSRAAGVMALVMLSVTVALGIAVTRNVRLIARARFATTLLHRGASLIGVALVALHLIALVADSYVDIRLVDAFVPFMATYRPFWTGLGAICVDLLVVITVTSLIRDRVPPRVWKGVHLLAYALWPIAVAHGLGAGTDNAQRWFLLTTLGCLVLVAGSLIMRFGTSRPSSTARAAVATRHPWRRAAHDADRARRDEDRHHLVHYEKERA